MNIVPNAAFPFCVFNHKPEGIHLTQYNETYCNQFQVSYLLMWVPILFLQPVIFSFVSFTFLSVANFQRTWHVLYLQQLPPRNGSLSRTGNQQR